MKALRAAFAAVCCILGPASIGSSDAQTADWFNFQVCNPSGVGNASISILYKNDQAGSAWHLAGWYNIPDGGCANIGSFWRDRIYVFGQGNNGTRWDGSDTSQCVNLTTKFDRLFSQNYADCNSGETSVGMFIVQVPPNVGNYTLNLR